MLKLSFALFVSTIVGADEPSAFIEANCVTCHSAVKKSGRLDLSSLSEKFNDADSSVWIRVHERVAAGEMPPKEKDQPDAKDREAFLKKTAAAITSIEDQRVAKEGRATLRRMNRQEYEYAVRDLFGLSWLPLREMLPEDAVAHGYNTVGDALDVSHVQIARYLAAAEFALNAAADAALKETKPKTKRYYARDQGSFTRKFGYNQFNTAPERATFPVIGTKAQPDVRRGKAPMSDPKTRDLEGVGLVQGAYEPVEPKFNQFKAPASGRYKIKIQALSVWVGPNGSNENLKNPQKKFPKWNIPNLDDVQPGRRSEPVTVFAERPPRQLRRLGAFDVTPEAKSHELEVDLLAGETIRPDASRLFRSRPGETRWVNPLAEKDGQPGVVYRWLEVEGPLPDGAAKTCRSLLFADVPIVEGKLAPKNPKADAKRLLHQFSARAYRRPMPDAELERFLPLIETRLDSGAPFRDAMLTGYTAVLCSPEFLTLHAEPGKLDDHALATRLSFFLWNSEPDLELRRLAAKGELLKPDALQKQTQRLLDDPQSQRFVNSFLDYWLDLRKINDNSPDGGLYGDYYLDDLLIDGALEETRLFFSEMLHANLPTRNVAKSDFAFLNERLADHYGLPKIEGTALRKVKLPKDGVRGGLLTQASVLTVTANGTTTSPVVRGAWVMDRILGTPPRRPPPDIPAVEPDIRGAVTIREQLAKHRSQASCASCHASIDPPGFALESFDVMGGFRTKYRAMAAEKKDRVFGFGKGGQPLQHREALPVDCKGELPGAGEFTDVKELKAMLAADDRRLARNLVRQFTIYATGAPLWFRDRAIIERILDQTAKDGYRTADLIHALVQSELFRNK